MSSIVGYVGHRQVVPLLLEELRHTEYRGYDSVGIAAVDRFGKLQVRKTPERLNVLGDIIARSPLPKASLGIGHLRWATHGAPNEVNAHPHTDSLGRIALVHNGIIENYIELRNALRARGYEFRTQTDTEVLVALVAETIYRTDEMFCEPLHIAVEEAVKEIQGAYSIAMICADEPGTLVASARQSPMYVGYSEGECVIASDQTMIGNGFSLQKLSDGAVISLKPA